MRSSDTCFSQTQVDSISRFSPMYHNVPAQTSQINFLQQQQQQQSTNQQQPMQCQQYYCYPANQQAGGMLSQNQYVQPYQQDPYVVGQQQQPIQRAGPGNLGPPLAQAAYNGPSIMQPQAIGYGSLPAYVLPDQTRSYFGTPGPIFILPNNCPNPPNQTVAPTNPSVSQGCPGIGINCPATGSHGCPVGSCYPYPVPVPMYNPYLQTSSQNAVKDNRNCGCCPRKFRSQDAPNVDWINLRYTSEMSEEHRCTSGPDDTICIRKNCPSAINLQALASQLLAIPGIVSCAATRLVLRKVPGSDITTSMDETVERAKRSLMSLTKEQLLSETRAAQQINALINLHMTANPPPNVIPVLTTLQLKVNLLKAQVDASLNRRLSENQGLGVAEGTSNLDAVMLATKTDQELRDLLGTLRQKECDERVNLNFAPYKSQRLIAESRLTNVQNKIAQIDEEMDRRRAACLPGSAIAGRQVSQQSSDPGCTAWYGYTGDIGNTGWPAVTQNYRSPDPFRAVQVRNPKRLNLKPHVGSPETTYQNAVKASNLPASSRSTGRDSDEEQDLNDTETHAKRLNSKERPCCNCDKSSDDESPDEGKKKLGVKIRGARKIVTDGKHGGVCVVKLSPHVTIVIDDTGNAITDDRHRHNQNSDQTIGNGIEDGPERDDGNFNTRDDRKDLKDAAEKIIPPNQIGETAVSGLRDANIPDSTEQDVNRMESSVRKVEYDVDKMANAADKMENAEYKMAETSQSNENTPTMETLPIDEANANSKNSNAESLREETVHMVTKIQYEPSAFRDFRDVHNEDEKTVIEERYKPSFAENSSLKSTSIESTVDRNHTIEFIPPSIANHEEFRGQSPRRENSRIKLRTLSEKSTHPDNVNEQQVLERIDHKIQTNRETDVQLKRDDEQGKSERLSSGVEKVDSPDDLICGALSTIGNHVASFGSLIGKIAALKLHRSDETCRELLPDDNSARNSLEEENAIASGSRSNAERNEETRKEIGRWKYIRFADAPESANTSVDDFRRDREDRAYTLPRLKHSVIEDKTTGGKYVVTAITKHSNRRLGEPYKTGRSLVIRSRPKNSATTDEEPFAIVSSPRRRDKNCIALSLADVRSLMKNHSRPGTKEVKASDKFWMKSETPDLPRQSILKERKNPRSEKCIDVTAGNDPRTAINSRISSNDEHLVQLHEYSKIHVNS